MTLIDRTFLYVREVLTAKDDKYSYNWQTEAGELIRRWDNAPHWQQEIGSIHHVHVEKEDVVEPSSRVHFRHAGNADVLYADGSAKTAEKSYFDDFSLVCQYP